jgi:hypothetical protein
MKEKIAEIPTNPSVQGTYIGTDHFDNDTTIKRYSSALKKLSAKELHLWVKYLLIL